MDPTHMATLDGDDIQQLENVLADTPVDGCTRRSLIKCAVASAAVASVAGPAAALAQETGGVARKEILDAAITAEALAVTYLTGVTQQAPQLGVTEFADVLKAANAAEFEHYQALQELGAKPTATEFFVPNRYLQQGNVFPFLEKAEELFINAYLIGTTQFAKAKMETEARYTGEIAGVEAQHRALARFAQDELPNNLAFEQYPMTSIDQIVQALEKAGIGFGKKGEGPGKVFNFPAEPPADTVVDIKNTDLT